MLDPAAPTLLRPVFAETIEQLRQIDGGLDMFRRLDGRVLIALDGTEYHCSRKIHCPHCSTRVRGNGQTEYYHGMLAATLVAPGHDKVIPLEPEFIVPRDGAEKQDCENMAAKRWLTAHAQRYAEFDPVYLGDDLFSRQPLCQAVLDTGGHFIFNPAHMNPVVARRLQAGAPIVHGMHTLLWCLDVLAAYLSGPAGRCHVQSALRQVGLSGRRG